MLITYAPRQLDPSSAATLERAEEGGLEGVGAVKGAVHAVPTKETPWWGTAYASSVRPVGPRLRQLALPVLRPFPSYLRVCITSWASGVKGIETGISGRLPLSSSPRKASRRSSSHSVYDPSPR